MRFRLPDDRILRGKPALVVIDVQHDFMDPGAPCYNVGAELTIAPMKGLIEAFRAHGLPIIFTREAHRPGGMDAGLEADPDYGVPWHTVEGTIGFEIIEPLAPLPGEVIVDKRRYNCFLGTELEFLLTRYQVETLIICGVSSDICVHWTAGEAFQRDFHVRVVEDCTAGMSVAKHEASLLVLRDLCSAGRAIRSDDVVAAVEAMVRGLSGSGRRTRSG
jgi:nicotinamidase-related amidase